MGFSPRRRKKTKTEATIAKENWMKTVQNQQTVVRTARKLGRNKKPVDDRDSLPLSILSFLKF